MSMDHTRTAQLFKSLLIISAIINASIFLSGILLGVMREDLLVVSVVLTGSGVLGIVAFVLCWIARPRILARLRFNRSMRRHVEPEKIDQLCTDTLIKNIRGIPFLIQAIQFSMEDTHYRDMMTELGEGVVRTSVIHTAPACTSMLDSEDEQEEERPPIKTPRNSGAEEQWLPIGERWRNEQLRLSLEQPSHPTTLFVFPFRESTPRSERSMSAETAEIVPNHGSTTSFMNSSMIETEVTTPDQRKRVVRCIGMSAAFLTKIGSGIGSIQVPEQ
ncbi:hypothetical protein PENTCL1PPCAC_27392 [Pristionchus entomophagus]|uniref:Uncharacterized protein n=1 Tax=Pristionchus entomophagus TaxID=358040 RepID=A0AAV5UFS5_9BILA|nr:hypothetical protein PENTCL1PPCAC_27392 [Pristionchus entomophagus]